MCILSFGGDCTLWEMIWCQTPQMGPRIGRLSFWLNEAIFTTFSSPSNSNECPSCLLHHEQLVIVTCLNYSLSLSIYPHSLTQGLVDLWVIGIYGDLIVEEPGSDFGFGLREFRVPLKCAKLWTSTVNPHKSQTGFIKINTIKLNPHKTPITHKSTRPC